MKSIKFILFATFISVFAIACKNDTKSCHANTSTETAVNEHNHGHDHSEHSHEGHAHHNEQAQPERTPLYKEVMAVHDEAMPWMGDIHRLIKKLNGLDITDAKAKAKVTKAVKNLEAGDEAMMSWMSGFDNTNETIPYLTEQLQKAKEMKTKMRTALDNGTALYKELSHE